MLGDDITQNLRAIKTQTITRAQAENWSIPLSLRSKGISFGAIAAFAIAASTHPESRAPIRI
jgi:hypothetical protein